MNNRLSLSPSRLSPAKITTTKRQPLASISLPSPLLLSLLTPLAAATTATLLLFLFSLQATGDEGESSSSSRQGQPPATPPQATSERANNDQQGEPSAPASDNNSNNCNQATVPARRGHVEQQLQPLLLCISPKLGINKYKEAFGGFEH
ncbi:hypothetical protein H5410_014131 [Solanum commersonii]|uniref:Uncharacterized protein n=1 Tax=Solanum commersonii TaxID=4109 RepID=A0A9J5ZQC6_SOLCO|nr:hypothetical protein H5410_014131 [Solanum commersonii]